MLHDDARFDTRAIHAGQEFDPTTGAVIPPVYLTSTYVQDGFGDNRGYEYARGKNPTREAFEACINDLEGVIHARGFFVPQAGNVQAAGHIVIGFDRFNRMGHLIEPALACGTIRGD